MDNPAAQSSQIASLLLALSIIGTAAPAARAEQAKAQAVLPAKPPYARLCETHLATLVDKGTDRYGRTHAPIWVRNLDLETLNTFMRYGDGLERVYEERMSRGQLSYSSYVPWGIGHRAIRISQRPAGCSNLYVDQPTIRAATLLETLSGKSTYRPAIEAHVKHYLKHFIDSRNGLIRWGVHVSYDVFYERFNFEDGDQHEMLVIMPMWPVLYEIEPKIMKPYLEKYWYWHTDSKTGRIDRHNTRGRGLGFAMAAGEIVLACAFLHTQQPDGPWLDRALQITKAHWDARDTKTNLFANRAYGDDKRFDRLTADTSIPGCWSSRVLIAGRLTGSKALTEIGRQSLLAWARYGWDDKADKPWSMLKPDGTPVDKARLKNTAYEKQAAYGHWNFWKDYAYGFESPFQTLTAYAMAAKWTQDPELLAHAKRLAECYRRLLPANGKKGTFAANYGRLISFYLAMAEITGDGSYRQTAKQIADEAIAHLWAGRMFRGFADRTYYAAIEGQGQLIQGLVELEAPPEKLAAARDKNPFFWNF